LLKQHFPNYRFKRQHPVSQFIADFYSHKLKLVIEIDGSIHLSNKAGNNDKIKDEFMQSLGLKIIRFTNDEVCKNGERAMEKLNQLIEKITS
jgi:imidazole glycerol-phosphate synthase subunit HisF